MTRNRVVSDQVAERLELDPDAVEQVINTFMSVVRESLLSGVSVEFGGIGKLKVKTVSPRKMADNIRNRKLELPRTKRVRFETSRRLREDLIRISRAENEILP